MNITIQNIELDEQYQGLMGVVPFRSVPVRCTTVAGKWKLRLQYPEDHRLWAWVTYIVKKPFKISSDRKSYSSIIDVTLHDVEQFAVDYDDMSVTFADGTAVSFELPIERYSNMEIEATY